MPLPKPTVHSSTLPPAALDGFDLGPSGFAWARQEMNALSPSRAAQSAWQAEPAAAPFPSLLALHGTAERERQGEAGVVRIVVAADRAEQGADGQMALEALHLSDASAAPMAGDGQDPQVGAEVIGLYPEGPASGL